MDVVEKLVRGDASRRTRLHTEAGQLVSLRTVGEFAAAACGWVYNRATARRFHQPWWVPAAAHFLDKQLKSTDTVLELGSGYSTLWLAERCARVVSIEDSEEWKRRVLGEAARRTITNLEITVQPTAPAFAALLGKAAWDVVVVDCESDRAPLFAQLGGSDVRPRLVVYDNTDRARDRVAARQGLTGYISHAFVGFPPHTVHASETTIYVRRD